MATNIVDLLAIQEQFADYVATLAGMETQLVNQGFTKEQARAIITHLITSSNP